MTAACLAVAAFFAVTPVASPTPSAAPQCTTTPPKASGLLVVGVGDSITFGTGTSHPPETSFLARAASSIGARYVDLGIAAAATAQIASEVDAIPLDADVVVVYVGTNDVSIAADFLAPAPVALEKIRVLEANVDPLIAAVRARVPAARLVLITVRDFGRVQRQLKLDSTRFTAAGFTAAVVDWNAHLRAVAAQYGAAVLDLEKDPQWYVAAEYGGAPGDVHPNDDGAARLARAVAPLLAP